MKGYKHLVVVNDVSLEVFLPEPEDFAPGYGMGNYIGQSFRTPFSLFAGSTKPGVRQGGKYRTRYVNEIVELKVFYDGNGWRWQTTYNNAHIVTVTTGAVLLAEESAVNPESKHGLIINSKGRSIVGELRIYDKEKERKDHNQGNNPSSHAHSPNNDEINALDVVPDAVVTMGNGPCEEEFFNQFLQTKGIAIHAASDQIHTVVIGRNFAEDDLDRQIELRRGNKLFVYSQEMFLSFIAGLDPYKDPATLKSFTEDHPVFEYLNESFVTWPTTHIIPSAEDIVVTDWAPKGVLDANGYHVGKSGLPVSERRNILRIIFTGEINPVMDLKYNMDEWGENNSSMRLQKLANTIASLTKNAKRRKSPPAQAISDWESDLDWLKDSFYNGRFSFHWPSANVY